jgi:membrane dipeptidase
MLGAEGYSHILEMTKYPSLHQVGASIPTIRLMYELGVRYITLTHSCDNPFATSCTTVAQGGEDNGLTPIGHEAVREMNRLGNSPGT